MDKEIYASAMRDLHYLLDSCRLDIAFVTSRLASYTTNPTNQHMLLLKYTVLYLKVTPTPVILFATTSDDPLVSYCDADFA